ncbi:glycosyltransferase family 8 protein [Chaetomium fimeti]|uniref:Glycosyltransferase family 8 protein n=1 Tax=Chaetomium fimeti TaxID=1854472 RepID=A0AAE0LTB4_9PEZI|nr:glycosyltransferase family 8 protein [Chaetomium fimeti]
MCTTEKVVDSYKIWASLITNDSYLPGLLTLVFSLRKVKSKYPLVALYTGSLPEKTLHALAARDIPIQHVPYLCPGPPPKGEAVVEGGKTKNGGGNNTSYDHDPRFRVCFTKLAVFSLTGYSRIVMLDADMLVRRNMDELFDVPLDEENRLFAATHACLCNPHHLPHYPPTWTPANCAYTTQHPSPTTAQHTPPPPSTNLSLLNGGLLTLRPSPTTFTTITTFLRDHATECTPAQLPFAEQSLLSILFRGRWAALPYVYNALAPMRRRQGGHGAALWRDGEVRAVHFILVPKPWEGVGGDGRGEGGDGDVDGGKHKGGDRDNKDGEDDDEDEYETWRWWREADEERRRWEGERGLEC